MKYPLNLDVGKLGDRAYEDIHSKRCHNKNNDGL